MGTKTEIPGGRNPGSKFEVFIVVKMLMLVFWVVILRGLVGR
jgi:hypothetical protein